MYGIKDYNVQFNIIAHSMGGLLSRYYLRFGSADLPPEGKKADVTWDGSKFLERLIIVGTPNAGYLDTVLEMQRGRELPPLPPAVIGTWATYYQMMPFPTRNSVIYSDSKKPVDLFDINVWKKLKWGLADPEQSEILKVLLPKVKTDGERRKIALDHLEKCLKRAKRFIEVMSIKSRPPKDVQLYLVTGNSVKTTRLAEVDPQTGNLKVIKMAPGDGKVSESSAMFDDRAGQVWKPFFSSPIHWHNIMQLRAAHMGLTTAPAFKDNLLFLLNAVPSPKQLEELKKGNKL